MDTTLALPSKVTNAVQPPLKKAELIRALAIRKQAQLTKEQAELKALYQSEDRAITAEIQALASKVDLSKVVKALDTLLAKLDRRAEAKQLAQNSVTI